tara:strand:+ start:7233 stop:7565 length:333 start_codon:yes stop_codon:yes gene_type:complete
MATAYKFAQVQGTAAVGTFATLYTTPSSTEGIISSIIVCNQAASAMTIRIGLDSSAGTPGADEFLVYDAEVAANDTLILSLGLAMAASKYLRVSSSANTCSFTASVSEIS